MTAPVMYGKHERVAPGTPCILCSAETGRPVMDHCHKHGWARGVLCSQCNILMGVVDRGSSPRGCSLVPPLTLAALVAHAARCPDCEPIAVKDLGRLQESRLALRMEPDLGGAIDRIATAKDRSVAWIVREALKRYVEQEVKLTPP